LTGARHSVRKSPAADPPTTLRTVDDTVDGRREPAEAAPWTPLFLLTLPDGRSGPAGGRDEKGYGYRLAKRECVDEHGDGDGSRRTLQSSDAKPPNQGERSALRI